MNSKPTKHSEAFMATQTPAPALNPEHIMQIGLGFWASKALLSAVELGVLTELARGPQSLDSLTKKLGLHPRSARDFFDTLVALQLLERRSEERRVGKECRSRWAPYHEIKKLEE